MSRLIRGQDSVVGERTLKHIGGPVRVGDAASLPPERDDIQSQSFADAERKRELASVFAEEIAQIKKEARDEAKLEEKCRLEAQLQKAIQAEKTTLREDYTAKVGSVERTSELLSKAIESVDQDRKDMLADMESFAVTLTIECLYKLCGESAIYQSVVKTVIADVVKRLDDTKKTTIKVSEQELKLFQNLPENVSELVNFVSEPELKPGDCFIQSGFSTMDMSLSTQLDQIKNTLVKTLMEKENATR